MSGIEDPADARAALVVQLELVLPGRVLAYPPQGRRFSTPCIWIEQPQISEGEGEVGCRFPVWIVVDGASEAQVAALDDLSWNAWLAVAAVGVSPYLRPAQLAGYRCAVVEVSFELAQMTLCYPPAPKAVTIPPVPIDQPIGG